MSFNWRGFPDVMNGFQRKSYDEKAEKSCKNHSDEVFVYFKLLKSI